MKLRNKLCFLVAMLLILAMVAGCAKTETTAEEPAAEAEATAEATPEAADLAGDYSFGGSTTVEPVAVAAIEAFEAMYEGVKISYDGVGSSSGVKGVLAGTYTLGGASRGLKDSETAEGVVATPIANDGIAVVVNGDVAVDDLSLEDIAKIFAGEITNWSEVGGDDEAIVVVNRDEASGTRAAFFEMVLEKVLGKDPEPQFIADAITTESNGDMVTKVGATPGAIGYCGMGYLAQAKDAGAKEISVGGIVPSVDTVLSGDFPISRQLNIVYMDGALVEGTVEAMFLEFLLSEEGQLIAEDEGFIALGDGAEATEEAAAVDMTSFSGDFTFGGSTTVEPVALAAIEAIEDLNGNVKVSYEGVGSSSGVKGVIAGTYSLGGASRELKDKETAEGVVATPVASDGIAVIVNNDVAVDDLSLEDVAKIFSGEVTNWKEVGGEDVAIAVVNRDEASGTRAAFFEMVLEKILGKDPEPQFIADAVTTESNGDMVTKVGATPGAIGYCGMGYLDKAKDAGAKSITVGGVEASTETVLAGDFPIARNLNIVTMNAPKAGSFEEAFINFILSEEGQLLVEDEGFIAIN